MEHVLRTGDLIEFDAPDRLEIEEDCRVRGLVLEMVVLEDERWDDHRIGIDLLVGRKKMKDIAEELNEDENSRSCRALDHISDGPQIEQQVIGTNMEELEDLDWDRIRHGNGVRTGGFRLDTPDHDRTDPDA